MNPNRVQSERAVSFYRKARTSLAPDERRQLREFIRTGLTYDIYELMSGIINNRDLQEP